MKTFYDQVERLLKDALRDLDREARTLSRATKQTHPKVPRPRGPLRFITRAITLQYNARTGSLEWYFVKRDTMQRNSTQPVYIQRYLVEACDTPRKLVRALTRIEAYGEWLRNRTERIEELRKEVLQQQQPYLSEIHSRLAMIELREDTHR